MKKSRIKKNVGEKTTRIWCAIIVIIFLIIIVLNEIPMIIYIMENKSEPDINTTKSISESSLSMQYQGKKLIN